MKVHRLWRSFWCGSLAGGIIEPYFLKDAEGMNVTINGNRYRAMLDEFRFPKLRVNGLEDILAQMLEMVVDNGLPG